MEATAQICARDALASLSAPVFLAGIDVGPRETLILHVAKPNRRRLEREAEEAFARADVRIKCRVRPLNARRLAKARSLQAALQPFRHEQLIYDPTESVGRGQSLLRCASSIRAALGDTVHGIYLEPQGRTLFIVVDPAALASDGNLDATRQRELEGKALAAIEAWQREVTVAFALSFRLCLAIPRLPLVPLDVISPGATPNPWRERLHSGLVAGGIATLLGALIPSYAHADGPAVSALNGKLSAEGGVMNKSGTGIASGSLTAPLGFNFGGQLDASVGTNNDAPLWGVAGQAFWRDPGIGLVGGFASHVNRDLSHDAGLKNVYADRFGAEGEAYLGQFTPTAAVGYQNLSRALPRSSGVFGIVDLAWYPTDNLQLSGGADVSRERTRALLGAEFLTGSAGLPGLSIFGEAGITGERDSYGLVGFRYYFGPNKSLIRRHREDDPPSLVIGSGIAPTFPVAGSY